MANENYYDELDLRYPEIAIAAKLFYTTDSSAYFYIPVLMPMIGSSAISSRTSLPPSSNILNTTKPSISTAAYSTGAINIPIAKERMGEWYLNKVPAGTKFIVSFIGGDINKPFIIGRYV